MLHATCVETPVMWQHWHPGAVDCRRDVLEGDVRQFKLLTIYDYFPPMQLFLGGTNTAVPRGAAVVDESTRINTPHGQMDGRVKKPGGWQKMKLACLWFNVFPFKNALFQSADGL